MEIVQFYTLSYHKAIKELNCLPPSIEPRATGHIIEQINLVKKILKNGFAYESNGSIYLDVKKYNKSYPYGILSGRNLDDTLEGTRKLDGQSEKKNAVDFAIWKKASQEHIMKWDSPWGEGIPGWHLECSAMSQKYLGEKFDIHGGGMDLIFPHHEAEIAQSNACNNCNPVNYWMHNNMVTIEGKKMGKSLGNFINLDEFFNGSHEKLDKAYDPMTIRFFILQAHYRNTIDFSNNALKAAEKGYAKLINAMQTLENLIPSDKSTSNIKSYEQNCYNAINDDFNTPILIANIFDIVKIINSAKIGKEHLNSDDIKKIKFLFKTFVSEILGLSTNLNQENRIDLTSKTMDLIIKLRSNAKKNQDFYTADLIRNELNKIGINIKDNRNGTIWEKNDK